MTEPMSRGLRSIVASLTLYATVLAGCQRRGAPVAAATSAGPVQTALPLVLNSTATYVAPPPVPLITTASRPAPPPPQPKPDNTADVAAARQHLAEVQAMAGPLAQAEAVVRDTEQRIASRERTLRNDAREFQQALAQFKEELSQVRANHCCSQCGDSEWQIESQGRESFEDHLHRVAGVSQSCKPGKEQEVVQRWAPEIEKAKAQLNELNQRKSEIDRQKESLTQQRANVAEARRAYEEALAQAKQQLRRAEADH